MDWKKSFDRETLMDGFLLYKRGRVSPLHWAGHTCTAMIDGVIPVKAVIENGTVSQIGCGCRYGRQGHLCAHDAALLFAIEAEEAARQNRYRSMEEPEMQEPDSEPESWQRNAFDQDEQPDRNWNCIPSQADPFAGDEEEGAEEEDETEDFVEEETLDEDQPAAETVQNTAGHSEDPANLHRKERIDNADLGALLRDFFGLPSSPFEAPQNNTQTEQAAKEAAVKEQSEPSVQPEAENTASDNQPAEPSAETEQTRWNNPDHLLYRIPRPVRPAVQKVREPARSESASETAEPQYETPTYQAQTSNTAPENKAENPVPAPAAESTESAEPSETVKAVVKQDDQKPMAEPAGRNMGSASIFDPISSGFHSLLDRFTHEELLELIQRYALGHPDLKDYLISAMANQAPEEVLYYLEQEAERRLLVFLGPDAVLSSRRTYGAAQSFTDWLGTQVQALQIADRPQYAADLLEEILEIMEEHAGVRTEELIHQIGDYALESLELLLDSSNTALVKDVFSWISFSLDNRRLPDFRTDLIRMLEKPAFDITDLAQAKYDLLVRLYDGMEKEGRSWRSKSKLIVSILDLEEQWPSLSQTNPLFKTRYAMLPAVRIERARRAMDEGRFDTAAAHLEAARRQVMTPAQEETLVRMLIEADRKQNHPEKALRELNELIFILNQGTAEDIELLSQLESEQQWKEDLARIEKMADPDVLIEVYDRLGLDQKLLDKVEESGQMHHLQRYEDRLLAVNPERTAKLWIKAAQSLAKTAQMRHDYRRIALSLSKAAANDSTRDQAKAIASDLMSGDRRRALTDELKHAGFSVLSKEEKAAKAESEKTEQKTAPEPESETKPETVNDSTAESKTESASETEEAGTENAEPAEADLNKAPEQDSETAKAESAELGAVRSESAKKFQFNTNSQIS